MSDPESATVPGRTHDYRGRPWDEPLTWPTSVPARLDEWAVRQPERPWLTGVGRDGSDSTISFAQAAEGSRRVAAWIARTTGSRAGDTVALLPTNDIRSALAVLALLRLGCVTFVVGPDEPAGRRTELLGHRPLAAILAADPEVAGRAPDTTCVPDPAGLPAAGPAPGPEVRDPRAAAFLFGTSGSTATAKTVAQSGYAAAVNAEAQRRHHGLGPGVRILGCLPVSHVNGLHLTLLATLWAGAHAVLLAGFDARTYPGAVQRYRPAVASVVPTILEQLVAVPDLVLGSGFRYFVSAAAPLSAGTANRVHTRLGARVVQGYGLTETTNMSATVPIDLDDDGYRALMLDVDVPAVGVPLFGNEIAVLRRDGSSADHGETGEVCMRGHNVMLGYAGNERATAESFAHGWFHSGDLGRFVEGPAGVRHLVLNGRSKNMAKVLGVAVSFEEMERRLTELPGVADAACFAIPDRFRGEAVVAVLAGDGDTGRTVLDAHLRDWFPPSSLPTRYVHADRIPRTTTGKILRARLPELFSGIDGARDEPRRIR